MDELKAHVIAREQWADRPIEEVFAFFSDAANLETITPPWLRFSVISPAPIALGEGALIDYELRWRGLPLRWISLIEAWGPPRRFIDRQVRGPYRLWRHLHSFEARGDQTLVRDEVRYRLPFGPLGIAAHRLGVRRDLEAVFDYRAQRIAEIFGRPSGPNGPEHKAPTMI